MREAPSRCLIETLWQAGASVHACDPAAIQEARRIYGERSDLLLCTKPYDALKGADALVVVTEWKQFCSPDFVRIRAALKEPVIFDGRNLYNPEMVEEAGLCYYGIGRSRPLGMLR